jgi:hypothetical protein
MWTRRTRRAARPVALRCEALEDRCVPAAVTFDGPSATLTVTGTAGQDAIVINDDGTNNAGAVSVMDNGVALFASGPTAGVNQVHSLRVLTLDGPGDSVTYNLNGSLTATNRSVNVQFGNGQGDAFTASVYGDVSDGLLALQANAGTGGATLHAGLYGRLTGSGQVNVQLRGGIGADQISVDARNGVNVGPQARLAVQVDAGAGKDQVDVAYEGELRGTLYLDALGGSDDDTVSAALTLDGYSDGLLTGPLSGSSLRDAAAVRGGGGNDRLSFVVSTSGTLNGYSAAEVDGGAGTDFAYTAGGFLIKRFNCELPAPPLVVQAAALPTSGAVAQTY